MTVRETQPGIKPGISAADGVLWRIEAPHFCWAIGKPWREVRSYMRRKGWSGRPVRDEARDA